MNQMLGLSHKQGYLVAAINASEWVLPNTAVGGLAPRTRGLLRTHKHQ